MTARRQPPRVSALAAIAVIPLAYVLATFYLPLLILFAESVRWEGLGTYSGVFLNPDYLSVIGYSLTLAVLTTSLTFLIALPAAYHLAFNVDDEAVKSRLLVLFTVPMLVNFLLRTYTLMNILSFFGLTGTYAGMVIGMVYEFLPYMLLPLYSTFERIERRYLEAAQTLGARPAQTFLRVTLPLAIPGVASGVALVFLMSFTEFIVPAMLGGVYGYTVGYLIWDLFLKFRNWPAGSALAFVVTLASLLIVYAYARWGLGYEA
uniref:ABC transporter permease n=1 Tax=Thermofilum pendens TaxID=2269 RepID=A0A7C4D339_THEPE